ncbi:TerB family tellurite resistance protein [Spirosoma utsteinense]|uniref:Tellurite resistance protein B-like protein n=1 Tax=Spirosoma utsteinense TaxID=2585773 RepID=A0ABR6WD25_9BACT|nr:TerB family tellurite resistance protein [Spirosoma utsteinense]MBC3788434.1 putative tellurite resistance protein B-like protein [Spirosoma utsteinense]MBC3794474.1 putative tellurite resistance protein B-like protein [Spirosoma utsteinense]
MYSPDVAVGLGSLVYALSKVDGQLQPEEINVMRRLLAGSPYSDLAISALFLQENVGETSEKAYAFGLRRMAHDRVKLDVQTEKWFVNILWRVAMAYEGVSGEERAFIRRFRSDLQRVQARCDTLIRQRPD